jgi:hypothetical protein
LPNKALTTKTIFIGDDNFSCVETMPEVFIAKVSVAKASKKISKKLPLEKMDPVEKRRAYEKSYRERVTVEKRRAYEKAYRERKKNDPEYQKKVREKNEKYLERYKTDFEYIQKRVQYERNYRVRQKSQKNVVDHPASVEN